MRAGRRLIDRSAGGSGFDGARKDLYARSSAIAISKIDFEEVYCTTWIVTRKTWEIKMRAKDRIIYLFLK
jgi:hypothetical protein